MVYIRAEYANGLTSVTLVAAKSRVAPLKKESIPRLELCGSLLLAKLLDSVRTALGIDIGQTHAWTDSTVVLNWLDGNPRRLKTYEGNRISSILERLPTNIWKHVPSLCNPADCASRGLLPKQLLDHQLWWQGPEWLSQDSSYWPSQPRSTSTEENPEVRVCINAITSREPWLVHQYSSLDKLRRVLAWALRFLHNIKSSVTQELPRTTSFLSVQEIVQAEMVLIKQSQERRFGVEIKALQKDVVLPANSPILPLRPFLDSNFVLKVGGRLARAQLKFSKRHPIILHHKDPLTHMIVRHQHLISSHAGPTLLMSILGRTYHIVSGRRLVRSCCRQCVICKRQAARPEHQLMGQLPSQRLTPGPVFQTTGVDLAGPLYTKYSYTRRPVLVKTYICVFVSFSVRAVHLEPVSDLSAEAFLAALRRFISRRGKPKEVFSDNGTNFVGASRELEQLYKFLSKETTQRSVSRFCVDQHIQWHFSPERAPHFGGLWEATVKAVKTHLKKVIGDHHLTFEELMTVLCQIESCLNSRPLNVVTSHDEDGIEPLTPGHFLIGQPLEAIPDSCISTKSQSLLRRWNLCQAIVKDFWTRWSTEYITQLNKLSKWKHPQRNLQEGDIVLLKDQSNFSHKWPLARIMQTHAGRDGKVRVVTIKTSSGTYTRPTTKIVLLVPQDEDSEDSSLGGRDVGATNN